LVVEDLIRNHVELYIRQFEEKLHL